MTLKIRAELKAKTRETIRSGLTSDLIIEDQKVLPEVSGPLLLCGEKREEDWESRSRDDWTRDEPARDEGERVWEACCFDIIS
jgi:hypothetical protein